MTDLPITCTLLGPEPRQLRKQLLDRVYSRVAETRPLGDGYAFRFVDDQGVLSELMQLIQLEHQCCAFLKFRLTVEPGGGPVWLELSGPVGTKAFLETAFGFGRETADQGT